MEIRRAESFLRGQAQQLKNQNKTPTMDARAAGSTSRHWIDEKTDCV